MAETKILRLPLKLDFMGRSRLPFVVSSSEVGTQILHVRLYDENSKFLKEKNLKVRFAKNQGTIAL